jgi:hypothetical protein
MKNFFLNIFPGTTFHQMFGEGSKKIAISPQLTLAVFQYLTTTIEPFRAQYMSEVISIYYYLTSINLIYNFAI